MPTHVEKPLFHRSQSSSGRPPSHRRRSTALVDDIIAPLHFADDPMQQARSDHFVLAKLRRDVLKHGVAGGLRYGFGGLHQPVEIVSGQSQSQLVQWGHGKLHIEKNKNAATGLWFSECISPFRRMPRRDSAWALVRPTLFTIVTERDHPTVNMLLG